MAEHTPGPWEARKGGFIYAQIGNDPNWCIGKAYNAPDPTAPDALTGSAIEANGRLIAAAPALLEALEWAEAALAPFSKEPQEKSGMAKIRAAIAAAKGEGE